MGKREPVALLSLSSWCLVSVVWLFLAVPLVCLQFVIVVFPDHTHLIFLLKCHHWYYLVSGMTLASTVFKEISHLNALGRKFYRAIK